MPQIAMVIRSFQLPPKWRFGRFVTDKNVSKFIKNPFRDVLKILFCFFLLRNIYIDDGVKKFVLCKSAIIFVEYKMYEMFQCNECLCDGNLWITKYIYFLLNLIIIKLVIKKMIIRKSIRNRFKIVFKTKFDIICHRNESNHRTISPPAANQRRSYHLLMCTNT